jgi:peptidoglycan-N-acetylglucosamine deacetylase
MSSLTPPDASIPDELPLFWRLLEGTFQRVYRTETLEGDPRALLAYNSVTHRGSDVPLACGTVVHAGDRVLELHFRRQALLPLMRDGDARRMGLSLIKLGDRDIPRLALALERDPRLGDVKAIHALTLFHRGIARYGFEVMPVRNPLEERWFTAWHRLLMARDHARGARHVRENQERLVTRHVWLSREELIRRYGETGDRRRRPAGAPGASR